MACCYSHHVIHTTANEVKQLVELSKHGIDLQQQCCLSVQSCYADKFVSWTSSSCLIIQQLSMDPACGIALTVPTPPDQACRGYLTAGKAALYSAQQCTEVCQIIVYATVLLEHV